MTTRICTMCNVEKSVDEYWKDRSKKHGLSARCKSCKTALFNEYRKKGGYDKKRYWKDPQGERERHLQRKYGITQTDYDDMFASQGGECAICHKTQDTSFNVDHDHDTGEVRGLLCSNCNRMIGYASDNKETLANAIDYLSSRKSQRRS